MFIMSITLLHWVTRWNVTCLIIHFLSLSSALSLHPHGLSLQSSVHSLQLLFHSQLFLSASPTHLHRKLMTNRITTLRDTHRLVQHTSPCNDLHLFNWKMRSIATRNEKWSSISRRITFFLFSLHLRSPVRPIQRETSFDWAIAMNNFLSPPVHFDN